MNILITGSSGQLGQAIKKNFSFQKKYKIFLYSKKKLNINNYEKINKLISRENIFLIINCAAFTNVDKAELKKKEANKINNQALYNISKVVRSNDILLIHISTDYVYNSERKILIEENFTTNPKNYYGLTKLKGEKQILKIKPKAIIIRTSWLYSEFSSNFVKNIIKKIDLNEQINLNNNSYGSPTNANDLAKFIIKILKTKGYTNFFEKNAIFNFSNSGCINRYKFVKRIINLYNPKYNHKVLLKISNDNNSYIRPKCSCISSKYAKKIFKFNDLKWDKSLIKCIKDIKKKEQLIINEL